MASQNAKAVAKDVIETMRKHKKVNLGKIIRGRGYSRSVSLAPTLVTQTQTFQKEINPVVKRLENLRNKVLAEMEIKDISKERIGELSRVLRDTNHDIQLLEGKATDRIETTLDYDQIQRIARRVSNGDNSSEEESD